LAKAENSGFENDVGVFVILHSLWIALFLFSFPPSFFFFSIDKSLQELRFQSKHPMTTANSPNYPQLTSTTFTSRATGTDSDDEDQADATVAPQTTTIRVTRPVDPIDFVLPRPILSQKELYDLAFRYVLLDRTKRDSAAF
jgi:hypothetical protein